MNPSPPEGICFQGIIHFEVFHKAFYELHPASWKGGALTKLFIARRSEKVYSESHRLRRWLALAGPLISLGFI